MTGLNKNTKISALIVGMVVALCTGCDVEIEGEEGNFTFRYLQSTGDAATDLAVGSRVDVEVLEADGEEVLQLDQVYSEASDVIEVVDEQPRQFSLEAVASGRARIGADATVREESLSDTVEIRAAEVAELELSDRCSDGVFLTDNRLRLGYRMRDSAGGRLTGYGHYPVTIEPAQGGTVNEDHRFLGSLEIFAGQEPGSYEVIPDVDGDALDFELIDAADIDLLEPTSDHDDVVHEVEVGETEVIAAFGLESQGRTVCGPIDSGLEITTDTPAVCQASSDLFFAGVADILSLHTLAVEGLDAGQCQVTVAVPDTDVEEVFEVTVQ